MATVNDILEFFEEFAPVSTAMEFDNVGLLVGDKNRFVRRALVSLDITPEVVYEAEKLECELIISHHPVIFQPLKRLEAGSAPYL
ncbi:MAG: Nif3-like dinuclear metal center hexameric protein, partial [Ruminococcus sp.]|nr:Nif3-like dinuclear metal center hexameric protein [Ruminococcus sp.]